MAKLGTTTFDQGANDTEVELTDHGSAPSPTAGKLYANTTSVYWEDGDLTGGGGETVTKKASLQLANTTGLLDMTESACTAVNLVVTSNTTLDGPYFTKHTITGTSRFGGILINSDVANTSTTFVDSGIAGATVTASGHVNHRTDAGHPYKYPKVTANTSMYFDGTTDYLSMAHIEDFAFRTNDFTVDFWTYPTSVSADFQVIGSWVSGADEWKIIYDVSEAKFKFSFYDQSAGSDTISVYSGVTGTVLNTWTHVAVTRFGSLFRWFINGSPTGEQDNGVDISFVGNTWGTLRIGEREDGASDYTGYLDGIRLINGYAAYTSEFSVPTRPYTGHEFPFSIDTKVKYCGQGTHQTSSDVGAAVRMGNDSTGSGVAKVSFGDTFNVNSTAYSIPLLFENSASGHNHIHYNIWTEAWGNTEFTASDATPIQFGNEPIGTRGIYGGGWSTTALVDIIEYITIASPGEATDFGNLTTATASPGGASNGTRGVFAGGYIGTSPAPTATNVIEYITIGSTGNATDFGDYTILVENLAGVSNGYRGLFTGGESFPASTVSTDTSNYVEIATTGNGIEYGNLSLPRAQLASMSNSSRGVFAGGVSSAVRLNTIDYFTISSSANAIDFGDTVVKKSVVGGTSDGSRGVIGGGNADPGNTNQDGIEYIAIGTTGNATDWGGELSQARRESAASSNGSRGVWAGGYVSAASDTIDYITIGVSGVDATDFGNLTAGQYGMCGFSGT